MANAIMLKGDFQRDEKLASGTVKPGMLLELTSADKVKAHATEGGFAERAFAVEDVLQGHTISDNYSDGDLVSYNVVVPGAVVNALIAAGEDVDIGEQMVSDGHGALQSISSLDSAGLKLDVIGVMMEAVDNSASPATASLGAVRIL